MARNRKFRIVKNIIKQISHFCVLVIYLSPSLVTQAQPETTQPKLSSPQSIFQVDITVDSNAPAHQVCSDLPDDCSLRGAITLANLSPEQEYLIEIPEGVYNLSIPGAGEEQNATGDLDIYGRIALAGAAAETTQIDGNALDRVIEVHSLATVTLQDMTITDGMSPPEVNGGGIYNAGSLVIQDSQIENNTAGEGGDGCGESGEGGPGGNGGAVLNIGSLTINQTTISGNRAGEGGDGCGELGAGGPGGNGGAIFNAGSLTINQTNIFGNLAGVGGSGAGIDYYPPPYLYLGGDGGDGGDGGGIYNVGVLRIYGSTMSGNRAGSGGTGGGSGLIGADGSTGYGGNGGGIYNLNALTIEDSVVSANFTRHGGDGGGIYSSSALRIEDSEIGANITGNGSRARDGGKGGGIYIERGTANMLRSQVNLNITGDGGGSWLDRGGLSPGGSGGAGGGIYIQQGVLILDDVSIRGNKTGEGGAGNEGGYGGGVFNAGALTLNSSVMRTNQTGKGGEEELDDYMGMDLSARQGGLGGGIFSKGDLLIIYSQIEGNQTGDGGDAPRDCAPGGAGGGIFNQGTARITYSQVNSNKSGNGGESDEPGGYNCEGGSGGGVNNTGEISLKYSSVLSNTTGDGGPDMNSGSGGGLYNDGSLFMDGVSLMHNQVGQNGTGGSGGGAYLAGASIIAFHNAMIADNHMVPGGMGSGVFANTIPLNLWHTTLARNTGGDGSGLYALDAKIGLTNTILVSHTVGINAMAGSVISLNSTMWGSGLWANLTDMGGVGTITHTHDLTSTPGFINPDQGDYHLGVGSEARDQGIHTISTTDLDNQPRPDPDANIPDLGADEYWSPTPLTAVRITAPISGTTYANIPFMATVTPITATPNIYYVWMPSPATGQGTSTVTYFWHTAGSKTIHVTALNAHSNAQAVQEIPIIATEFKIFMPNIYSSY